MSVPMGFWDVVHANSFGFFIIGVCGILAAKHVCITFWKGYYGYYTAASVAARTAAAAARRNADDDAADDDANNDNVGGAGAAKEKQRLFQ